MTDTNWYCPRKGGQEVILDLGDWRVGERSWLEIWMSPFKRDTREAMRMGCLVIRSREEENTKVSFEVRVGGGKEESVKDQEEPEGRRGTEVRRSRGQEGGEVGGDHILQDNVEVGQLELGNKNKIRDSLALYFVTKCSSQQSAKRHLIKVD